MHPHTIRSNVPVVVIVRRCVRADYLICVALLCFPVQNFEPKVEKRSTGAVVCPAVEKQRGVGYGNSKWARCDSSTGTCSFVCEQCVRARWSLARINLALSDTKYPVAQWTSYGRTVSRQVFNASQNFHACFFTTTTVIMRASCMQMTSSHLNIINRTRQYFNFSHIPTHHLPYHYLNTAS